MGRFRTAAFPSFDSAILVDLCGPAMTTGQVTCLYEHAAVGAESNMNSNLCGRLVVYLHNGCHYTATVLTCTPGA